MLRPTAPRCAARTRDRPACPPPCRSPRESPFARARDRTVAQRRPKHDVADDVGRLRRDARRARAPDTRCARATCTRRASRRAPRATARSRARSGASVPLNTMCSSRCDTPIRSRGSCSDAARTHAPNETDRTPGMCSESTVSPLGRTVRRSAASAAMRSTPRRLTRGASALRLPRPPRPLRGRPPRSPPSRRGRSPPSPPPLPGSGSGMPSGRGTSAFIDRRRRPRSSRSISFTFTRSPFFTTSSVFSVRSWRISEMCTRPSVPGMISTNAPNGVVVFTVPSYVSPTTGSAVSACTIWRARSIASPPTAAMVTRPRVVDRELGARLVLDAADRLALRSDEVADLLGADVHRDDARRERRQVVALRRQRLVHLAEDVQAAFLRLRERLLHDLEIEALDLDVHLDRRDAVPRAGDLEVHVAEVILGAEDVGEDRVLLPFLDQAHRHAGDGGANRNAGVEQRERGAADRRHRRRAVRLENVRHDADRVREFLERRQHALNRALGQVAVADLAARRAAHRTHFTRRERREVVVQHERLGRLASAR